MNTDVIFTPKTGLEDDQPRWVPQPAWQWNALFYENLMLPIDENDPDVDLTETYQGLVETYTELCDLTAFDGVCETGPVGGVAECLPVYFMDLDAIDGVVDEASMNSAVDDCREAFELLVRARESLRTALEAELRYLRDDTGLEIVEPAI